MENTNTPDQNKTIQQWYSILENLVQSIQLRLDGPFIAASNSAGFYYGKAQYYTREMLESFDFLVQKSKDPGAPLSLDGQFSVLYKGAVTKIGYVLCKADEDRIQQEATKSSSLVGSIGDAYNQCGLPKISYPSVIDVMAAIKTATGVRYDQVDFKDYPFLASVCSLLTQFVAVGFFTARMSQAMLDAADRLAAIGVNMTKLSDANGALQIDQGVFVLGWDKITDSKIVLESLQNKNASISYNFSMDSFSEKNSVLHLGAEHTFTLPVSWVFSIQVKGETTYDLSTFAKSGATVDITIKYNGVTTISATPEALSQDNKWGWFAQDILKEAAEKTGDDNTSGYKFLSTEYDPSTFFGPDGQLKRLKTYVVSTQPEIHVSLKKFDVERMKSAFTEKDDVDITLFGIFKIGGKGNSYSTSSFDSKGSSEDVEINFAPGDPGTSGDITKETAFILGGVPETY